MKLQFCGRVHTVVIFFRTIKTWQQNPVFNKDKRNKIDHEKRKLALLKLTIVSFEEGF